MNCWVVECEKFRPLVKDLDIKCKEGWVEEGHKGVEVSDGATGQKKEKSVGKAFQLGFGPFGLEMQER